MIPNQDTTTQVTGTDYIAVVHKHGQSHKRTGSILLRLYQVTEYNTESQSKARNYVIRRTIGQILLDFTTKTQLVLACSMHRG